MGKRPAFIASAVFILILILSSPKSVLADQESTLSEHAQVLGVSTESALPQIPPTTEGPGLILPDSPLFFLDQVKQNIRLILAITSENKAKVRAAIAGERLAELRLMLAKNNEKGIQASLQGVSDNLDKAAQEVNSAQLTGRDVSQLAKAINNSIKEKQKVLEVLESQSEGELKARTKAAAVSLLSAKVKVENALPQAELEDEVRNDLIEMAQDRVGEASDSARALERSLNQLQRQASSAAQNSLSRREEALKKAIEAKNETTSKVEEKLLEAERKKQEKLLEAQGKAAQQAREAIQKAQEAALKFQQIQRAVSEIRNQAAGTSTNVTPTPKLK